MYRIMTEELVLSGIRINETTGREDSDSRMTSFEVIMPLKLQSPMKAIVRGVELPLLVFRENECLNKGKMAGWSLIQVILLEGYHHVLTSCYRLYGIIIINIKGLQI